jgi:hypothetical protein
LRYCGQIWLPREASRGIGTSVADPGFLSRILIFTHPGSRISDPGSKTATKERGEKNYLSYFFVAKNFTKFYFILILKCRRKKFRPIFKEL